MEKQYFQKRRTPIFIKHGITAAIFISIYYLLDYGLMRLFLFIQLFVLIKDLRLRLQIKDHYLLYRTLFRTRMIPVQKIRRILLAEKTTMTDTVTVVNYYYRVHVETGDIRNSLLWEIPASVIPKQERRDFTRIIQQLNPSASVNLVTPIYTA